MRPLRQNSRQSLMEFPFLSWEKTHWSEISVQSVGLRTWPTLMCWKTDPKPFGAEYYFSASDFLLNQRLFGLGPSAGAGAAAGFSSSVAGSSILGSSALASFAFGFDSVSFFFAFFSSA